MKKTLVATIALAIALPFFASPAGARALVTEGSNEIGASGYVDFESEVGLQSALDLRYAYFFLDKFSVGGVGGFSDNDYYTHIRLGLVCEYNFPLSDDYRPLVGTDFVPFIGLGAGLQYADSDDDDVLAGVLFPELGTKFFLSDDFALTASVLAQFASDDVFMDDHKATSTDISLRLGMRFYF